MANSLSGSDIKDIENAWKIFGELNEEGKSRIITESEIVTAEVGETIVKPGIIPGYIFLVLSGKIRYLGIDLSENGPVSLAVRGRGELVGWAGILRGGACDYVIASEKSKLLALKTKIFCKII